VGETTPSAGTLWVSEGTLYLRGFTGTCDIHLLDALGRTVFVTSTAERAIELPALPAGLLIAQVRSESDAVVLPLVK
jgi:hypothetical protein